MHSYRDCLPRYKGEKHYYKHNEILEPPNSQKVLCCLSFSSNIILHLFSLKSYNLGDFQGPDEQSPQQFDLHLEGEQWLLSELPFTMNYPMLLHKIREEMYYVVRIFHITCVIRNFQGKIEISIKQFMLHVHYE